MNGKLTAAADNLAVRSMRRTKMWTFAGDNGNAAPAAAPSFSDEDCALLAEEIPAVALLDEADLMASLTPEQQATIAEDADPVLSGGGRVGEDGAAVLPAARTVRAWGGGRRALTS